MIIFIVLASMTILTLLFALVISTRRRFRRGSGDFRKETKPPEYYQTIWSELGKNRQINRKKVTLFEKIGQGCFGDVYRGEYKSTDQKTMEVAVKLLRDQNVPAMHEFLSEANRMKDFSHPNILSLVGVSWDPIRKAMVLLPYMKNGDLRSYISNDKNRPTVRQLITWGIQVADGMEYLASLKFVHRDLATRNCMLDEELICRISDFGLTRDIIDRDYYLVPTTTNKNNDGKIVQTTPRRLPIRWLSPESIESSKYTIQSDVVSCFSYIDISSSSYLLHFSVVIWRVTLGIDESWENALSRY
jgi:serine/threonine protein kinase